MKFDINTTTMGEIIDDPATNAALSEVMKEAGLDQSQVPPADDFIRSLTWAAASMQLKQMMGVEIYNKIVEKLQAFK